MQEYLYGSLTLAATTPIHQFPVFHDARTINGNFTGYRGSYSIFAPGAAENEVVLAARGKHMNVYVSSPNPVAAPVLAGILKQQLPELDARFDGARQLFKSNQLMRDINSLESYVAVINNIKEHPYFNILVWKTEIHLVGVYDTVNRSVRLVFTTDPDFIEKTRSADYTRYVFHRFPTVKDRPLFLHTQSLISRWYSWSKAFRGPDSILRCFNVLECYVLKDAEFDNRNR
jgi:hypothetical protein